MTQQQPTLYPTVLDAAPGIIAWDPMRLQCQQCGAIHEQCRASQATCIILSGYHFHGCEHPDGIRYCPDCLAAAVAACPNVRCKQ